MTRTSRQPLKRSLDRPTLSALPSLAPGGESNPSLSPRALPRGERLGALLRELEPRLFAVALRITRDPDSAHDVVQNACEKVVRHRDSFLGHSLVSTWVHRIVANEALMVLRRQRRSREVRADDESSPSIDHSPSVVENLLLRERRRLLREGLAQLCAADRDVLERCSLAGWTYAEYGRRTGTHPAAVKSRAFRARRRLTAMLLAQAESA
jgi:RNA polymerase sigma-70 factor (ECF subfamily)